MIEASQIDAITAADVRTSDGAKVGSIGQIFLDAQTGRPEWAAVRTGLFGTKEAFVPLRNAEWDGRAVHIAYDKDRVRSAPHVDPDSRGLAPDQQVELYTYYGFTESTSQPGTTQPGTTQPGTPQPDTPQPDTSGPPSSVGQPAGTQSAAAAPQRDERSADDLSPEGEAEPVPAYDDEAAAPVEAAPDQRSAASSPEAGSSTHTETVADVGAADAGDSSDGYLTRSEERLDVAVQRVPTERVRLHKQVVTEQETVTVTIRREELRIERVPVSAEEAARMGSGEPAGDAVTEIVLYEERPVVTTVRRPVERIRLTREAITEEQTVTGDVRKERIEMDGRDLG